MTNDPLTAVLALHYRILERCWKVVRAMRETGHPETLEWAECMAEALRDVPDDDRPGRQP